MIDLSLNLVTVAIREAYSVAGAARYYTTFNGSTSYVDFITARDVLTGESLSFSYYKSSADNANAVLISSDDGTGTVYLGSDGLTINLTGYTGTVNGATIVSGTTKITLGVVNEFALMATVDANLMYVATDLVNFSNAIIFNVVTPDYSFALDDSYDTNPICVESLHEDGEELATGTQYTDIINSNYSTSTLESSVLTIGDMYKYSITLDSAPAGGACRLRSIEGSSGSYISEGGTKTGIGTSDNTSITLQCSVAGEYKVTVSVKETTGAQYVNVIATDKTQELS